MILSHSKKFIFIKTRKCGGTSIQNVLMEFCNEGDFVTKGFRNLMNKGRNPFEEFSSLDEIKKYSTIDLNDYFKFGLARNPFSITLSRYLYQIRMGRLRETPTKDNFNSWVKNIYFNPGKQFNYQGDGTRNLLFDSEGNKIVEFIARLENIESDFEYIKEKLNLDKNVKLKKDNVSNILNINYRDWMDDESKDLVSNNFKFEIDYFNYKF